MIYLDSAATTPIRKEVLKEMIPFLTTKYGNPNSVYELGRDSRMAIDEARERVASSINANPRNIVFTSGGSEANNIVLRGFNRDVTYKYANEHTSSNKAADAYGNLIVNLSADDWIASNLHQNNDSELLELVWYMYVNNETGKKNPVHEIGSICSGNPLSAFGTDCVQALGFEKIDVEEIKCDFMTLSSHKIHGPKGVGALYVRDRDLINPLILGGANQEFGLRGGTENVAGIVGFGKACEIATKNLDENRERILYLRNLFIRNLDGIRYIINCNDESKILSIQLPGIDSETFVVAMSTMGTAISSGSACKNGESKANEALIAMGLNHDQAMNTVRFSFMESLLEDEVINAAMQCKQVIKMLTGGN